MLNEAVHSLPASSFAEASVFAEKLRRDETAGQEGRAIKK
jgi:hypothetical protein